MPLRHGGGARGEEDCRRRNLAAAFSFGRAPPCAAAECDEAMRAAVAIDAFASAAAALAQSIRAAERMAAPRIVEGGESINFIGGAKSLPPPPRNPGLRSASCMLGCMLGCMLDFGLGCGLGCGFGRCSALATRAAVAAAWGAR